MKAALLHIEGDIRLVNPSLPVSLLPVARFWHLQWAERDSNNVVGNDISVGDLIKRHNKKREDQALRGQTSQYVKKDTDRGIFGDCVWRYVPNGSEGKKIQDFAT